MTNFRIAFFALLILLTLNACQSTPEPTAPPVPEEGNVFNPSAPPAQEWNEIPIMPEAIAGEGMREMYGYKVDAEFDEIIAYYRRRLPAFKWDEVYSVPYEEGMGLSIFTRGERTLTITISDVDGIMLVLLHLQ